MHAVIIEVPEPGLRAILRRVIDHDDFPFSGGAERAGDRLLEEG
jgi:hypothetical protein